MKISTHVKKIFRPLYNYPFFDHLRAYFNIRPPLFIRPLSKKAAISDLFPWRSDDLFDTRFDLMNIPSLVIPEGPPTDIVTLVFFNSEGEEVLRHIQKLKPFENKKIIFRDLFNNTNGLSGQGTFACFHFAEGLEECRKEGCYIVERQYVSYSKKNDNFLNYVHGNTYGLFKLPNKDEIRSLISKKTKNQIFRPQCRLDDCDKFELIYTNPSSKKEQILIRLLSEDGEEIQKREQIISSRGMHIFKFDNHLRKLSLVENHSRIWSWRPIIFKYYESYFDVLHG